MVQTVKEFVQDSYKLVSANSPTVPLHGSDMRQGIQFMNELLQSFSASGLLITVAKKVQYTLSIGQQEVTFGAANPLDPLSPNVQEGRLANMQNAWLDLEGVTYPLVDESRNVFFDSYKYDPQVGLPRFAIITNETNLTRMRVYPAASQEYTLYVYGKFELSELGQNDLMVTLPYYYTRFLRFALGKDLAFYKGRSSAWDEKLEDTLKTAKQNMESVSTINLAINSANESYLNGAWRIKAGI
jgi:hypothetical protein